MSTFITYLDYTFLAFLVSLMVVLGIEMAVTLVWWLADLYLTRRGNSSSKTVTKVRTYSAYAFDFLNSSGYPTAILCGLTLALFFAILGAYQFV